MSNKNLKFSQIKKNDEFYTQLCDIENELQNYEWHFVGKTVYCNCDNPHRSNFFRYFVQNFNRLGLKALIATSYAGEVLSDYRDGKAWKAVVRKVDGSEANLFDIPGNELTELAGDGDFRSPECLEILDAADIVVTNPPFSLFRELVGILVEHNKQFLLLGNMNAVTYKGLFSLILARKVWLGVNNNAKLAYLVPNSYYSPYVRRNEKGERVCRIVSTNWYTNLKHNYQNPRRSSD